MLRATGSALIVVVALAVTGACKKDEPTAKSEDKSEKSDKDQDKKKKGKSHKEGSKAAGKGKKGGDEDDKPSKSSKKASSKTLKSDDKKKPPASDKVAKEHPCDDAPEGAAECHGDTVYFCEDKELYFVDCHKFAQALDLTGGTCFETEEETDCMACQVDDDGATECCDFNLTVCCDGNGNCYDPKK